MCAEDSPAGTGLSVMTPRAMALSLTAVLVVRVSLSPRDVALEGLTLDGDEHQGLRPSLPVHPDRRRHHSRLRVDALPHAPARPAIAPAGRQLTLALLETISRERAHDLVRSRDPALLRFDPGHPALPAKLVDGIHSLHQAIPFPCPDAIATVGPAARSTWIARSIASRTVCGSKGLRRVLA